jgi:hypothetical protein
VRVTEREEAYEAGWRASSRSASGDLDAAEARFLRRHGYEQVAAFVAGWSDAAIGAKKWSSLSS